jgi:hypothetical protein
MTHGLDAAAVADRQRSVTPPMRIPVDARASKRRAIVMGGTSPAGRTAARDVPGAERLLQHRHFPGVAEAATGFTVPQVAIAVP